MALLQVLLWDQEIILLGLVPTTHHNLSSQLIVDPIPQPIRDSLAEPRLYRPATATAPSAQAATSFKTLRLCPALAPATRPPTLKYLPQHQKRQASAPHYKPLSSKLQPPLSLYPSARLPRKETTETPLRVPTVSLRAIMVVDPHSRLSSPKHFCPFPSTLVRQPTRLFIPQEASRPSKHRPSQAPRRPFQLGMERHRRVHQEAWDRVPVRLEDRVRYPQLCRSQELGIRWAAVS